MILKNFKDFPRVGRIIGIDWGAKRIGVAVSDATREFVFSRPQIVINRGDFLEKIIADLIVGENVVGIVIGLPLYTDGTESQTTEAVREFADKLSKLTQLPIVFIDETLTSTVAQEQMGRVRVKDIKQKLDSESARVILENAISMINRAN
ncbi:MAG: Holliday junction resolvase RuvX [Alphaproteobacteria bacterium]|nr:Holliday junction resolvase RuvX [Alphaproteobacteria bacterium]